MSPTIEYISELWERFAPLVASEIASVMNRYGRDYHLEVDDLESVALETLWRCVERYEPARQVRTPRDPLALFSGFFKSALYRNLSSYARKVIPHYYVGHGSKARWHHVFTASLDEMSTTRQESIIPPGEPMPFDHLDRVRDVLANRIRELSDRDFIKLTEYAGVLLDGEHINLFHEREMRELRNPYAGEGAGNIQTQPRLSDDIDHHRKVSQGPNPQ